MWQQQESFRRDISHKQQKHKSSQEIHSGRTYIGTFYKEKISLSEPQDPEIIQNNIENIIQDTVCYVQSFTNIDKWYDGNYGGRHLLKTNKCSQDNNLWLSYRG